MPNSRYVKEPGFIYDLFFIFVLYYNKDSWHKKFINMEKGREDIEFYEGIVNKFPPFPEELRPFFNLKDAGSCFLTEKYFQENIELFFSGYGTGLLYKELADVDKMRLNLTKFYINEKITLEEMNKYDAYTLSKMLLKTNTPNEIKQLTMLIFMSTKVYCDQVIELLKSVEKMLNDYYGEHYNELVTVSEKTDAYSIEGVVKANRSSVLELFGNEFVLSACLININVLEYSLINQETCAIVGVNGEEFAAYLSNRTNDIDISLFGKIISDASRVKVIKMLVARGELYTGEIAQNLDIALPSTYYHLEMMMEAKMLHTRSKGRTVFYTINRDYFNAATIEIMKLLE